MSNSNPDISIVVFKDKITGKPNNDMKKTHEVIGKFNKIDSKINGEKENDFVVYENSIHKSVKKTNLVDRSLVIIGNGEKYFYLKNISRRILADVESEIGVANEQYFSIRSYNYFSDLDNPFNIYYILSKIDGGDKEYSNLNKIVKQTGGEAKTFYKIFYEKYLPKEMDYYYNNCFFELGKSTENGVKYHYIIQARFSDKLLSTYVNFPAIIRISDDIYKYMINKNKVWLDANLKNLEKNNEFKSKVFKDSYLKKTNKIIKNDLYNQFKEEVLKGLSNEEKSFAESYFSGDGRKDLIIRSTNIQENKWSQSKQEAIEKIKEMHDKEKKNKKEKQERNNYYRSLTDFTEDELKLLHNIIDLFKTYLGSVRKNGIALINTRIYSSTTGYHKFVPHGYEKTYKTLRDKLLKLKDAENLNDDIKNLIILIENQQDGIGSNHIIQAL